MRRGRPVKMAGSSLAFYTGRNDTLMYNPKHLYECELEKRRNPRALIDGLMTFIGGVALISSLPQAVKIWQSANVSGISLTTHAIALVAVLAWFLYGLYIRNQPLALTSGVSSIVLFIVVIQILAYR